jgi:CBS-domain-containing membrane protein
VRRLVNASVTGARVIAAYHERKVLPLMRQERRLFDMVSGASLEGTVLVAAPLDRPEVKKCLKSALVIMIMDAKLDIHPPMRPNHNVVDLVRHFFCAIS